MPKHRPNVRGLTSVSVPAKRARHERGITTISRLNYLYGDDRVGGAFGARVMSSLAAIAPWFDISPFSWKAIGTSVFCGTIIGVERQIRGKPVGIRTSSLITLGTYLFLTCAFLLQGTQLDPSRVVGQVITGIGFLGAGVMLAKDGAVVGVTSAATIWVLASIGVMIGTDHMPQAVKVSLLVVAILYGVDVLEDRLRILTRGVHAKVRTTFYRGEPRK